MNSQQNGAFSSPQNFGVLTGKAADERSMADILMVALPNVAFTEARQSLNIFTWIAVPASEKTTIRTGFPKNRVLIVKVFWLQFCFRGGVNIDPFFRKPNPTTYHDIGIAMVITQTNCLIQQLRVQFWMCFLIHKFKNIKQTILTVHTRNQRAGTAAMICHVLHFFLFAKILVICESQEFARFVEFWCKKCQWDKNAFGNRSKTTQKQFRQHTKQILSLAFEHKHVQFSNVANPH